jgi:RNA:NAD 2'-phosphotransferase (TPT1/KptA family)
MMRLDAGGWIEVETLLAALAAHGRPIGTGTLDALVAGTDTNGVWLTASVPPEWIYADKG